MKRILLAGVIAGAAAFNLQPAQAAGCLSGAAVGGVAGHLAGHHAVLGAAAGCAIGHHEAAKHEREREQEFSNRNTGGYDNHGDYGYNRPGEESSYGR